MLDQFNNLLSMTDQEENTRRFFYDGPGRFENIRDEDQAVLAEVGRITAASLVA